jgi:hypothetical protein
MDVGRLLAVVATAILFAGLFMLLTRHARKSRVEMIEIGKSNTRAVEENTAAIKELIRRLDEARF